MRVGTVEQNTERQLDGIAVDRLFTDHISGAIRNRPQHGTNAGRQPDDSRLLQFPVWQCQPTVT